MKTWLFILPSFIYLSCSTKHSVYILNGSKLHIDSVTVTINNYKLKFKDIKPNEEIFQTVFRDSIIATHDVVYNFNAYIRDSLVLRDIVFSNDLGHVPQEYKFKITDSLKLLIISVK